MTTEQDSVTKVFGSFFALLAVGGVILLVYSGIEHYRKTNTMSGAVYFVDFVGSVTTRVEVNGNERVFNLLKQAGGIPISSDPRTSPSRTQDNQCTITPKDSGWFPRFTLMCWKLSPTLDGVKVEKTESYSQSKISKEVLNFHARSVEAKKRELGK